MTVAVSVVELPSAMGVGETVVMIFEDMTSRVSPVSPQVVELVLPFLMVVGL